MRRNIVVERIRGIRTENQRIEIVERKGLGHPDYIADSVAEAYSRNLSTYYLENFGKILHHNVDKLEVIGGRTSPDFGGGQIIHPISILFSGRATETIEKQRIPVKEIAIGAALEWIGKNLRFVDGNGIRFLFETKPGSPILTSLTGNSDTVCNDTSFGVGYAPLSPTEKLVLSLEKEMNSGDFKKEFPFSGEDIKIMAIRNRKKVDITIANAFVDRFIPSIESYFEIKNRFTEELLMRINELLPEEYSFHVSLNALDQQKKGKNGCYLTVTGTSAEHGDDGSAGRGNRANGLITPNRSMSFEAVAGKNPVNHIGKIYNILAKRIAQQIYDTTEIHNTVKIAGKIGTRIDMPLVAVATTSDRVTIDDRRSIKSTVDENLSRIGDITNDLVHGDVMIC